MKKYIVYAGVNGAGKSTLYNTVYKDIDMPRINIDEIVKEFGDWRNGSDVMKAGKIAIKKREEYFSKGISFNQETTLCGQSIIRTIKRAKEEGYIVEMYYVGIDSVELAKERISARVQLGGHGIPDKDVERRYIESLENLKKVIPICDLVALYDNTEDFRRFAIYKGGRLAKMSKNIPKWYQG